MEGNTPRGTLLFRKGERETKGIILNNNFIIIIIMQILTIAWSKIFAKTSKELTNGTRLWWRCSACNQNICWHNRQVLKPKKIQGLLEIEYLRKECIYVYETISQYWFINYLLTNRANFCSNIHLGYYENETIQNYVNCFLIGFYILYPKMKILQRSSSRNVL